MSDSCFKDFGVRAVSLFAENNKAKLILKRKQKIPVSGEFLIKFVGVRI
jgi:hypothetical protein